MENRYITSIDIETTGLDFEKCSILSIGACVIDLDKKEIVDRFYGKIKLEGFYGEPVALNMNKDLIASMNQLTHYIVGNNSVNIFDNQEKVINCFKMWFKPYQAYSVVGKNFANFDLNFLNRVLGKGYFNRRILDVGSMYYEPKTDTKIPNLTECLSRAGFQEEVSHNALEDAEQVAKIVIHKLKEVPTDDEIYRRVNSCESLEELAKVIESLANIYGQIQGKTKKFDAKAMADVCRQFTPAFHRKLTREFGIRQQAFYILFYDGRLS